MRIVSFEYLYTILILSIFYTIYSLEFSNEILSYIEANSNEHIPKEEVNYHYKSKDNIDYNISISISSLKLKIKIIEIDIPSVKFKNLYSFSDLFFLNNYFRIFNSIYEIYPDLINLLENEIEVRKNGKYLDLIIPVYNSFISNITFPKIKRCSYNIKEKVKELYNIIDELKLANEQCMIKINQCLDENIKLKQELIDYKKNNILLISDGSYSLLKYALQISPYYNKITVLPPDYIIPRLNENIMNNFKIIIYDLKDSGYGTNDDINEMRKYLNQGGNIIVTHDQWFHTTYKGKSYELFDAILTNDRYFKHCNKIKILQNEHPVFSSFYKIDKNDLSISYTHAGYNKYLNKDYLNDMVIELDDDHHTEYLLIKDFGKGKLIYWNSGHELPITNFEEKLFINIISWLYKLNNN